MSTPGGADPGGDARLGTPITAAQVLLITVVLVFIGWLIARGIPPYEALLIASGGVAVGSGLLVLPRGLMKLVRAMGHAS
ncbi:hypothetical protein [Amycolatopsis australiensis]|uniref:hypothetical protein n=1 Tax=Amycolatopsis australiensis TaxID=546364 RepID=UPI00092FF9A4|nr:hypothetical protein [Amycolatopsis australiensis]